MSRAARQNVVKDRFIIDLGYDDLPTGVLDQAGQRDWPGSTSTDGSTCSPSLWLFVGTEPARRAAHLNRPGTNVGPRPPVVRRRALRLPE
ncbi:hypothetical protein G5V59_02560 [Nocardioides sp. W3-2-3]|uniref:hypothetical protein n=1 Tax=Nocardioides convexus TaxID=2712224 RepID=UPI002418540D|nr:hypothetical protein [Nocardioides convexus]NGZ99635.1 hypothetical protein [Nocardioides convexus]